MKQPVGGTVPTGPYSPGIVATGRMVFVSGQGPLRDGQVSHGTVEEETKLVLENIQTILRSAGADLKDVVQCRVFLADVNDFPEMNRVYGSIFPDPKPARTTVGAGLDDGIKVEIDCIAVLP